MPAQYDPNIVKPWRRAAYMFTELCICQPWFILKHRLQVTGRENVPPKGSFVAVANHLSNEDPPLLAVAIHQPVIFIAKQELYENPFTRSLVMFYGAISINRGKPQVSTFKAVKDVWKHGWALGMFIEGTRSKTPGMLGQPHAGPAYFARILKARILPVGIVGTDKELGKAYAHIGEPIEPEHDLEATTWKTMEALSKLTGYAMPPRTVVTSKSIVI